MPGGGAPKHHDDPLFFFLVWGKKRRKKLKKNRLHFSLAFCFSPQKKKKERERERERDMKCASARGLASVAPTTSYAKWRRRILGRDSRRRRGATTTHSSSAGLNEENKKGDADVIETTSNPALKAAWLASEQFGKVTGKKGGEEIASTSPSEEEPMTREEIIDALEKDYEKNYFIGGESEMKAYSSECVFADPFVSFTGLDRFKQNVGNLGTSLKDVECKVLKMVDNGDDGVKFYWQFSAVVEALPWRPKLAASGNTTHILEQKGAGMEVVKHIEAWDVDPWAVLKKLLLPASKLPENKWELGMLALSQKDGFGALQSISEPGLKLFAALFILENLPGVNLGGFETFTGLMFVVMAATEFWALLISFGVVKK